jgi:hypothetical protein
MKNEVLIELIHKSETESFKHTAQGQYFEVAPLGYLRYNESGSELGDTQTTIRLLPDELRIQRRGTVDSQFVLKPTERTPFTYRFGGAPLQMTAYTTRLDYHWRGKEGSVECFYELWQGEQRLDRIHLIINVSLCIS